MTTNPAVIARGIDLIRDGWTWRAAAADIGVAERTLRKYAAREGVVPARRPGQRPILDPARVQQMHAAGADVTTIAAKLGGSKTAVMSALDYAGIERTTRRVRSVRPITDAETDELEHASHSDPATHAAVALRLHAQGVPLKVQDRALERYAGWTYYRLRSNGYRLPEHDVTRRRKPRPEHNG